MTGGNDQGGQKPGFRKDGQPYKDGNTREDGSYINGKYRTPDHGKFRKDDGRKRGQREKGSKNLAMIWRKQLSRKITYQGETKLAMEWLVDAVIRRGINRSDRAAENALAEAARLDQSKARSIVGREDAVIAAYIEQYLADMITEVTEDQPEADGSDDADGAAGGESDHADQ